MDDEWLDAMRGIGILLVVLGHTLRGVDKSGVEISGFMNFLDVRLYATHVQVLFFVSGLLVVRTLTRQSFMTFLKNRVVMILWPMILWTYVYFLFKICAGDLQNDNTGLGLLATLPIPGVAHLWFLWALFQIGILFALFYTLATRMLGDGTPALIAVFIASCILAIVPLGPLATHWVGASFYFMPYFSLGAVTFAVCGRVGVSRGLSFAALVAFVGLFLAVPWLTDMLGGKALISMALCLAMFFAGTAVLKVPKLGHVLATLGIASMAIYVMHTIFSAGMRELLLLMGTSNGLVHLAAGLTIGILMPMAVRRIAIQLQVNNFLRI